MSVLMISSVISAIYRVILYIVLKPGDKIVHGHSVDALPAAKSQGDVFLGLLFRADYDEIRDLLQRSVAYLSVYLIVAQI